MKEQAAAHRTVLNITMEDDPFYIGTVDSTEPADRAGNSAEGPDVPVEELVPSMILKELQLQPHLSAAVFGYDIQQMTERPWAKPGANLSDYFNYGFNEKSWRTYCAMQTEGRDALVQKAESFFERIEGIHGAHQNSMPPNMLAYGGGPAYGNAPPGQGSMYPPNQFDRGGPPRGEPGTFFKTKMCQRFQEGRCTRGAACNFAHGAHELRGGPQFQPREGGAGASTQHAPRMPYPAPPSHGQDGVLGMPPPMGSHYAPPMPMSGFPGHSMGHEGAFQAAPQQPPSHTGFRMAPIKRERGDDGRVFEQGLE